MTGSTSSSPLSRVVLVSHEARRTGAPRVALEVLHSLRGGDPGDADPHEIICVLRAGGPLDREFAAAANSLHREPLARARAMLRRSRPVRRLVDRLDELVAAWLLRRLRPSVLYLNTVKSACYVRPALRRGIPTIVHVHELGVLASSTLARYPVGEGWQKVRWVACSTAARDGLGLLVGVEVDDIVVVPSPVDTERVSFLAGEGADSVPLPAKNQTGTLVVGACGAVNERKGPDLWLAMAEAVRDRRPDLDVRFRWIGRRPTEWPLGLVRDLGLDDVVEFVGEVADPYPGLAALDVFTLPSREDPFPLVVLEAMALGRAVVAFDVGGVREQLGEAGVVVPAERPDKLAEAVVALLDDAAERRRLGVLAAARARQLYDVGPFRRQVRRLVEHVEEAASA